MDQDLKAYLEAMERRIMAKINDGHERIVNRLSSLERDLDCGARLHPIQDRAARK
jgi:hypothetical protein